VLATSCASTGTTVVLYLTGIALARLPSEEEPFLHPKLLTDLSKLWLYAFGPCFCCHVIGTAVTWQLLSDGIFSVFIWAFVHIAIAGIIGEAVLRLCPVDESFRAGFLLSCCFPNAVALPIVILETICKSERFEQDKKAFSRASAYVFTYTLAWGLVFWPLATHVLQSSQPLAEAPRKEEAIAAATRAVIVVAEGDQGRAVQGVVLDVLMSAQCGSTVEREAEACRGLGRETALPSRQRQEEKSSEALTPSETCTQGPIKEALLNPVNIGLLTGLFLALVPSLQAEFFRPSGSLHWLGNAIEIIGSPTVVVSQFILAGTLGQPGVLTTKGLSCRSIALLCGTRLVLIPSALCGVMYSVEKSNAPAWLWPDDTICKLVLWVTATVPSAQSIVVLAQRFGLAAISAQLVVSFAWQYLAAVATVTGFTCVGLAVFAA